MTTRYEEIVNASIIYHEEQFNCDGWNYDFVEGAKWADQHLRKGLWDSEKVIMWLRANVDNYANYNVRTDECFVNDFEEDLRKAMEE